MPFCFSSTVILLLHNIDDDDGDDGRRTLIDHENTPEYSECENKHMFQRCAHSCVQLRHIAAVWQPQWQDSRSVNNKRRRLTVILLLFHGTTKMALNNCLPANKAMRTNCCTPNTKKQKCHQRQVHGAQNCGVCAFISHSLFLLSSFVFVFPSDTIIWHYQARQVATIHSLYRNRLSEEYIKPQRKMRNESETDRRTGNRELAKRKRSAGKGSGAVAAEKFKQKTRNRWLDYCWKSKRAGRLTNENKRINFRDDEMKGMRRCARFNFILFRFYFDRKWARTEGQNKTETNAKWLNWVDLICLSIHGIRAFQAIIKALILGSSLFYFFLAHVCAAVD